MNTKREDLVFDDIHYQPVILNKKAWQKIKTLNFDLPDSWVERGERNSFDRIKLIATDIKEPGTVLDIGCNIGFFSHVLQFLGNTVTGLDNDVHVEIKKFTERSSIETAKRLNKKYNLSVEFKAEDFIEYLKSTKRQWDYTLFLSVFHHLFIGYGYSDREKLSAVEATSILQLIDKHTTKYLYFEMDEKVGAPFGWGSEREVKENIKMFTTFDTIETLAISKDDWATGRTLFRCSRSGKISSGMPKLIPLSSSSRRNSVGSVRGTSLFLTREANDWDADVHPYGLNIKRQQSLREGLILEKLKNNPHPNVCQVLGYDDYWVELEFIEGRLLSSVAPSIEEEIDYLSNGIGIEEAMGIVEALKDALEHLHSCGIAHTDPISFNVMVDKDKKPKLIDVIGSMAATERLRKLDLEVFWKYCAMEVIERAEYEYLGKSSEEKMQELTWGASRKILGLVKTIDDQAKTIGDNNEMINEYREQIFRLRDELNGLKNARLLGRIIKVRDFVGKSRHRLVSLPRFTLHKTRVIVAPLIPRSFRRLIKAGYRKTLDSSRRYRSRQITTEEVENSAWDSGQPLVSVVIPYYNSLNTIDDTINSLITQQYINFEIIIVDDGSNDPASIKKFEDLKISGLHAKFISQKNQGVAVARNNGISQAKGKYIICLDSDDILEPTYIEKGTLVLETTPEIALVTTYMETFGVINKPYKHFPYDPIGIYNNNMVITAAEFKKDAWYSVEGYKPNIGYEDWEFWMNLAESGFWGQLIPETLFRYRTSMSSRYVEDKALHWSNLKKIRALHPGFKNKIKKRIASKRREAKKIIDPRTAFINLNRKKDYRQPPNSKPNVLITIPWMTFGGAETLILNYTKQISDQFNLTFITGLKAEHEWEYKFREITPSIYHLANLFDNPNLNLEFISNFILTRDIRALHIVHNGYMFAMLPELKKRHPKLKVVVTLFNDHVAYFQESVDYESMIDFFTSDNAKVAEHYSKLLSDKSNITTIPNGIDMKSDFNPDRFDSHKERKKLKISDEEIAVFFIGRLSEEKNADVFLDVAKIIQEEDNGKRIKFFVIGDGPQRPVIEREIRESKLSNVEYLGYKKEVAQFLSVADIFVLPSSVEGFPLSILEAMAMETVVVASSVGAIPDIIDENRTGFIVPPGSAKDITEIIRKLCEQPKLMESVKMNARKEIEDKYSSELLGARYSELYSRVLK